MKRFLITLLLVLSASSTLRADVGVSVTVGDPGFYGQINIGGYYPRPVLIYQEPVIVERVHVSTYPVYLRVPPGHRKHWKKYCHDYGACNQRVYFVDNSWYQDVYVPEYREHHGKRHHKGHGKHHDDRHDDNHHKPH